MIPTPSPDDLAANLERHYDDALMLGITSVTRHATALRRATHVEALLASERERWRQEEQAMQGIIDDLRAAIRTHRDQRGDDRCVGDDYNLYRVLGEPIPASACQLNTPEIMLADCQRFIAHRHDPTKRYLSPQRVIDSLEAEVVRLQGIITGLTDRVAKQSDQLSRRAEKPTVAITDEELDLILRRLDAIRDQPETRRRMVVVVLERVAEITRDTP